MKKQLDNLSAKEVMEHPESERDFHAEDNQNGQTTWLACCVEGVTEKEFRQQVLDLAKWYGWKFYFTWNSLHSPAGFPDVVLVRAPYVIFAELKSEAGKLTAAQEAWGKDLQECAFASNYRVRYYVWRPSDWESIEKILTRF